MECNNEASDDNVDSIATERMRLLKNAIHKAFEEIIDGVSDEEFRAAINNNIVVPAKNIPQIADKLHGKLNAYLANNLKTSLDELLEGEELDSKFMELSVLTGSNAAHEGDKAWRPPGSVEKHLRAPLITEKLKYIENLNQLVEEKEKSVEFLKKEVIQAREKVNKQIQILDELNEVADNSAENSEILMSALEI